MVELFIRIKKLKPCGSCKTAFSISKISFLDGFDESQDGRNGIKYKASFRLVQELIVVRKGYIIAHVVKSLEDADRIFDNLFADFM